MLILYSCKKCIIACYSGYRYALYAICATWYPECPDPKHPRPARLCRRACEQLQDEYCQTEYDYEGELSYVRELLPVCDSLPDDEEDPTCVVLGELLSFI